MTLAEKIARQLALKGLNQQKLAKLAGVSDSEVSRLMRGESNPRLANARRLAAALGVSLDYLADDGREADEVANDQATTADQREILDIAGELGPRNALRLLDAARVLGYEIAVRRLFGMEMKPIIEVGDAPTPPAAAVSKRRAGRASSA